MKHCCNLIYGLNDLNNSLEAFLFESAKEKMKISKLIVEKLMIINPQAYFDLDVFY